MKEHVHQPGVAQLTEIAETCACLNVRKAARAVTQLYDEVLQPSGLRVTQFTLLVAIALAGEAPVTQLANALVMDRTTLTRNLALLEHQGLVAIARGTDQRTRMVTLTNQGREALVKALPLWEQAQTRFVSGLGCERLNTLLADLSDVVSLTCE